MDICSPRRSPSRSPECGGNQSPPPVRTRLPTSLSQLVGTRAALLPQTRVRPRDAGTRYRNTLQTAITRLGAAGVWSANWGPDWADRRHGFGLAWVGDRDRRRRPVVTNVGNTLVCDLYVGEKSGGRPSRDGRSAANYAYLRFAPKPHGWLRSPNAPQVVSGVPGRPAGRRGLLVGGDHIIVAAQRFAVPRAVVEVEHALRRDGKVGVGDEDPRLVLPRFERVLGQPPADGRRRYRPANPVGDRLFGQLRARPPRQR
jgi:hypothetical protein